MSEDSPSEVVVASEEPSMMTTTDLDAVEAEKIERDADAVVVVVTDQVLVVHHHS